MIKRLLLILMILVSTITQVHAQAEIEMADTFRADGKIYVVVGILCIVFAGIIAFLVRIDRKIKKLENKAK